MASLTGIEQHLRSREELAEQVGLLRLGRAAAAARAWRELRTPEPTAHDDSPDERLERLLERIERVTGRPLAEACPPRCSCRGVPADELARTQR